MTLYIVPHDNFNKPQNVFNVNVGDNSHINAIGAENAIDYSSNTFNSLQPELFKQLRSILETLNSQHKQELLDVVSKLQNAHSSGNKKEAGVLFGKLLSLSFIADCVTLAQPILTGLFNYFVQ